MNFSLEGYRIGQVRLKRYLTKEELSEIIDISSISSSRLYHSSLGE